MQNVELHLDPILKNMPKPNAPFLNICHFVSGPLDAPGTVRKSALTSEKTGLDIICQDIGITDEKLRAARISEALGLYIKSFGREHTFLKWALELGAAQELDTDFRVSIASAKTDSGARQDAYKVKIEESQGTWTVTRTLRNFLVPEDTVVKEYFGSLLIPDREMVGWREDLCRRRAEAFGWILAADCSHDKPKTKIWNELTVLQSLLVFMAAVAGDCACEILVNTIPKPGNLLSPPMLVLIHISPLPEKFYKAENKQLPIFVARKVPGDFKELLVLPEKNKEKNNVEMEAFLADVRELSNDIAVSCNKIFSILPTDKNEEPKFFNSYAFHLIAQWFVFLIRELRSSRHEGDALEFYFVAGDKGEFEDRRNCVVKSLSNAKDATFLSVFDRQPPSRSASAARLLSKEHYPWFSGGRHALLWDASADTQHLKPIALVAFNGSSWRQKLAERFEWNHRADLPVCIIGYYDGHSAKGAIVAANRDKMWDVCRFSGGKWSLSRIEERLEALNKFLTGNTFGDNQHEQERKQIVDLIITIADNPSTGGIIVLCDENGADTFPAMGQNWIVTSHGQVSQDDRIALMAHDGASLLFRKRDGNLEWRHRALLVPGKFKPQQIAQLQTHVTDPNSQCPLKSTGSRRWSSALAAFNQNVEAIVVISQDGDIQCWRVNHPRARIAEDPFTAAEFWHFPKGRSPQQYDAQSKTMKD